jgi:hypothetical protein
MGRKTSKLAEKKLWGEGRPVFEEASASRRDGRDCWDRRKEIETWVDTATSEKDARRTPLQALEADGKRNEIAARSGCR